MAESPTLPDQGRPDPSSLTETAITRATRGERDYVNGRVEVIKARIDGMDEATKVLHETVTRTPTDIQKAIGHLKELNDEKFASVDQRFHERDVRVQLAADASDVRTQQAATASADALAAALQAAKELVGAQGEASAAAAVKSETSFTKQIDQIGTIIQTLEKALDARITELKERIDRGEGNTQGIASNKAGMYALAGFILTVSLIINVLAVNGVLGGGT